jgi:hypothetical protein
MFCREMAEVLSAHGKVRLSPSAALETALLDPLLQDGLDASPRLMQEGLPGSTIQLMQASSEDLARLATALSMIRKSDR